MKKILIIIMLIVSVAGFAGTSESGEIKKMGIVIFDGVLTSEVAAPVEVFGYPVDAENGGFEVYLISGKQGMVTSHEGLKLQVDFTFEDSPNLDILVVPSSYDVEGLINNKALVDFVKTQGARAEYLASNCAGAYIMGAAGLLDGRKVVTYVDGGAALKEKFPKADVQDEHQHKVMVDGNYVSSNGGLVSYEAAFQLLALIKGQETADARKEELYFNQLIR